MHALHGNELYLLQVDQHYGAIDPYMKLRMCACLAIAMSCSPYNYYGY